MNVTHRNIVAAARRWVGTPYRHQAAMRGAGTDCLGLIRGVWREVYGQEPGPVPTYSMDWSEPQRDEQLWRAARRYLTERPAAALEPGCVVLFRMRAGSVAKHLGIVTATGADCRFVHAYSGHGVIESPLSTPWRRRIVACFDFPQEIR